MNNKSILNVMLTVLLASIIIATGVWGYREIKAGDTAINKIGSNKLIGGDRDEYGCLVAAGYAWCEAKAKCLRDWEEKCAAAPSEADLAGIKQAFMNKYGKDEKEVRVTVNDFSGEHARGDVKFSMTAEFGEGGNFLAYKENEVWKLAFDGNGDYDCAQIAKHNFPASMISDCAGSAIDRNGEAIACTMDAKICPDGSAVGRVAPNCEFAPCPGEGNGNAKIVNPASAYCLKQGGISEIKTAPDGSQSGVCKFPDGSECDEWEFFRHECGPPKR